MLTNLYVKNFALIEEANVEFGEGLNILTGETGAGKSILIDAVNAALGGKAGAGVIRQGADCAYIELIFTVQDSRQLHRLELLEVYPEDGTLILSRKIMKGRSVSRINDETVTLARLQKVTEILIDIHGQHEHQSLLKREKHLEILDGFSREVYGDLKHRLHSAYENYIACRKKWSIFSLDPESRRRQEDFLRYEIGEITSAALKEGEEEELECQFRRMSHARRICETLVTVKDEIGSDSRGSAGEILSRAVRAVQEICQYDDRAGEFASQLLEMESLLGDLSRELAEYLDELVYDAREFENVETRLAYIRDLELKYGKDIPEILNGLEERQKQLAELELYEQKRKEAKEQLDQAYKQWKQLAEQLSGERKVQAEKLKTAIVDALKDLNFLSLQFAIEFRQCCGVSENGMDDVEFLISLNPGEQPKPLAEVVSGGELSRIMLAVKTVLADSDQIPTLIFDEIDTGISGRTAQQVSEKLAIIAKGHQVLCITHLPQIASMANEHFLIEKGLSSGRTETKIAHLSIEESVNELARLLGGAKITQAVLENAFEMKELALQTINC